VTTMVMAATREWEEVTAVKSPRPQLTAEAGAEANGGDISSSRGWRTVNLNALSGHDMHISTCTDDKSTLHHTLSHRGTPSPPRRRRSVKRRRERMEEDEREGGGRTEQPVVGYLVRRGTRSRGGRRIRASSWGRAATAGRTAS
jgi:hypothetical protein